MKIKIALVDDDLMVLELLSDFFEKDERFEVNITSSGGHSFIKQLKLNEPLIDLVLLDLRMADGNGLYVIEALKRSWPEIKIAVLSSYAEVNLIGNMLKMGINAFLPKQLDKDELATILYEVHTKGFYFSKEQIEVMRNQISVKSPRPTIDPSHELNEKEIEVLNLICRQLTAKEIAEKLFVSVKTIESRKSNLMLKLNVKNTAGLIIAAIKYKIVDPVNLLL